MKDLDGHKKIAVLIDADNAQIARLSAILDEISAHGHVLIKRAYGDWSAETLKNWKKQLNRLLTDGIWNRHFIIKVLQNIRPLSRVTVLIKSLGKCTWNI
tara:strand:+ start:277 stop:576 length:300 start_codon:yes stop_codon:yes gene_type:complete